MADKVSAYCVKCREQREVKDAKPIVMANGRPAIQGACPVCGTKLTRIVKAEKPATEAKAAPSTKK